MVLLCLDCQNKIRVRLNSKVFCLSPGGPVVQNQGTWSGLMWVHLLPQ